MKAFSSLLSLATLGLLWLSTIGASYPQDQMILHVPTVIALALLLWIGWKNWVSPFALTAAVLFWWLHILGARYSYCVVPYDEWCTKICGFSLDKVAGFERNQFDRLVHFAYGLLLTPMLVDLLRGLSGFKSATAHFGSFVLISATSSYYEIFEWLLTLTDRPERADRYVGMQGDVWDAQKDMALAMLGAAVASFCLNFRLRR